ncbi:MAG TPA: glycosyltransferase family 4 protein [Chloroflexota bacterium]|nr:glycosyltransferase family 4 protein [Chloroflexota bacterium]
MTSSGKLRICMICGYRPTPSGGGTEKYVFELVSGLLERGLTVDFACEDRSFLPDAENPLKDHLLDVRGKLTHPDNQVDAFREKSRCLADAIDFSRYDVIHSHGQFGYEPFFRIVSERGRPALVSTFHLTALGPVVRYRDLGLPEPREAAVDRATSLMEEALARVSDRCIAVSRGVESELIELYRASPDRITTILNWYDHEVFAPRDRLEARRRLGLSATAPYLMYIGHFNMSRGDILLDALRMLPEEVTLLVLHHESDWRVQREFGRRVQFMGHVDAAEMGWYYSAADLLIFPTLYAGFGLVLIEAMACGLPPVCFDYPAMNEVVTAESGYLVGEPTGSALAAAAIRALAEDRSAKSKEAIRHAQTFRLDRQIDRVVEVYSAALESMR